MPDTAAGAIALLKSHRSIRKFTDEPIADEMVNDIIGAGLAAATSSNLQGTTVIRVRTPETRSAIATLAGGQSYRASRVQHSSSGAPICTGLRSRARWAVAP